MEKKQRMVSPIRLEMQAMERILGWLGRLDREGQTRVLNWLGTLTPENLEAAVVEDPRQEKLPFEDLKVVPEQEPLAFEGVA